MAQDLQRNPVVNLSRGLVTEQTPLTPVDSSTTDELNMDIELDGRRVSRKGLAYIHNRTDPHIAQDIVTAQFDLPDDAQFRTYVWTPTTGVFRGISILCMQLEYGSNNLTDADLTDPSYNGNQLFFLPLNGEFGFTVAERVILDTQGPSSLFDALDFTPYNNHLIVTSARTRPTRITLDMDTNSSSPYYEINSVTATEFPILMRDFYRFEDEEDLKVAAVPAGSNTVPTDGRRYDTYNAGWAETELTAWQTGTGDSTFPPLTSRWHSALTAAGAFDYSAFIAQAKGSTLISGGKFIIDAHQYPGITFSRTNSHNSIASTDVTSSNFYEVNALFPDISTEEDYMSRSEAYAGRIFYAGHPHRTLSDKVFFSQVLEDESQLGKCYQKNDPTAQVLSDLVDDDGGSITIPGLTQATRLITFGDSLLVFSASGVWAIRPGQNGFAATSYRVEKITTFGTDSPFSIVQNNNVTYYINKEGVQTLEVDQNNNFVHTNVSRNVIQKYWVENYQGCVSDVRGVFDELKLQVHWLFNSPGTTHKTKCLVLDLKNQAFMPWTFDEDVKVRDAFYFKANYYDYTSAGNARREMGTITDAESRIMYIVKDDTILPDDSQYQNATPANFTYDYWHFADMSAPINVDVKTYTSGEVDTPFSAYLETTPNFYGDMHNDKDSKEVIVYTYKDSKFYFPFPVNYSTENVETETRVKVKHSWDFEEFENSQDAYEPYDAERIKTTPAGTVGDAEYEFHKYISIKQLKFRGRGKALKLRFESDGIYPINLLGYSNISSRDRDYDNRR
jgi:hypothetical protein